MSLGPDVYLSFSKITPSEADDAFAFHRNVCDGDQHVWPRTPDQIAALAEEDLLFGVRRSDNNALAGLCYILFNEDEDVWELGGLTVPEEFRGHGAGSFLVRFALAHTLAFEDPFKNHQNIIAHVHELNEKPRGLLHRVGFRKTGSVTVPSDIAPKSMKRNAHGEVRGDVFMYGSEAVHDLVRWLDSFDGTVTATGMRAEIQLGDFIVLEDLRNALRQIAGRVPVPSTLQASGAPKQ
jgi:RimJ/RimL family protein N-acetyltransferase